ncbi:MAG TPA: HAMP domain-containing sensor histidine kinase [Longimicrobiales bacterium]|nr:HAMP domain-containing sensor histidine kinase [Longimicrobiales bacterium]
MFRYPLDPRSPHPVFKVLESGQPLVMSDLGAEFRDALSQDRAQAQIYDTLGLGSMLMVPLVARGVTRGAMGFYSAAPRRYGAEELAVAQDLAVVAALAVDNARLYRDARAAVEARDDLIAVVSHDLGNPLSAIRIGTSLLLRSLPESEQQAGGWKHLDFIRQSAQQMENLINDLLDVKRLESGGVPLQLRELRVDDVVSDVIDVFRPIVDARNVRLDVDTASAPPIRGDHQRLVQVLSNLVSNAVKFTEPGGSVSVRTRETTSGVLFTVADTGIGIAPEHIGRVFDRFWQVRREGKKGLGLGLSIAKGIVEGHGGRIWVESTLGEGTTFLFSIPAAEPAAAQAAVGSGGTTLM